MQSADVVVYDRLIDPRLLDEAPARAERVFVGKARGFAMLTQPEIEQVLVERARAGKRVVRLKGGDPFVFGRGGEEVETLAAAGIAWEVVPGITSAIAAPASAGIPVTHREFGSTVTVVTGHEDPRKQSSGVNWRWLAQGTGTVVVLMGLEWVEAICHELITGGRPADTPAAVISAGTWAQQHSVIAPLAKLTAAVRLAELRSPAVIVIGDVVRCAEIIATAGVEALARAG